MESNLTVNQLEVAKQPSFAQLKQKVSDSGLLERQPFYYLYKIPLTLGLLIPGIAVLMLFDNFFVQMFNAVYLAVVFTQIVFIGHDCGHRQIFRKPSTNDKFALFCIPSVGVGYSWWCDTHNRHHGNPNMVGADPAIEYDFFAFSEKQAVRKKGIIRSLVKFQAFYLIPSSMFYPILMRINSFKFLLTNKPKYFVAEILFLLLHFPIYFWLVFGNLSLWTGIGFVIVHQSLFSLFLVSTFAPNHKGMEVVDEDHTLDFLHHQILTAQNVQSSRFADFWFGGLNYQIEHHLFPRMSRNKLKKAQTIVKPYCEEHSIPYQESTAPKCYWEILKFLYQVCEPLRNKTDLQSPQWGNLTLAETNNKETDP